LIWERTQSKTSSSALARQSRGYPERTNIEKALTKSESGAASGRRARPLTAQRDPPSASGELSADQLFADLLHLPRRGVIGARPRKPQLKDARVVEATECEIEKA
jgi:hypothetical protein